MNLRRVTRGVIDLVFTIVLALILLFLINKAVLMLSPESVKLKKLLYTIAISFCVTAFFYNRIWSKLIFRKPVQLFFFVAFQICLFFVFFQLVSIHKNIKDYYEYFASENFKSWEGNTYTSDTLLGYKLSHDQLSSFVYIGDNKIPVKTDKDGFRIPADLGLLTYNEKPIELLFLGCSFTFGAACKAEDGFPYLVAKAKEMNYVNAGVGGYGLSQMLILAEELIPRYRPKYVIVQRSHWLIERSMSEFAPTRGGYHIPVPYFADSANSFRVEKPIYQSSIGTLFPITDRELYKGRFLTYYFTKGFPYFGKEQLKIIKSRLKNVLGIKPKPTKLKYEAELFAYEKMSAIAKAYNVKVIVVSVNSFSNHINPFFTTSKYLIANADSTLNSKLNKPLNKDDYFKLFGHWTNINGAETMFDSHPNARAHSLIAETILSKIE